MFCEKCGAQLESGDTFCGECGTKVEPFSNDQSMHEKTVAASAPVPGHKPKRKSTIRLTVGIAVILAALIAGGIFAYINFLSPEAKYEKYLALGQKYLTEENYEQVIIAMKKAIDIDEMRPEAYVVLAGAYALRCDENTVEDICDVLEKGYEKTESDTIVQAFANLADQLADQDKMDWAFELLNFGYELTEDEELKEKLAEVEEKERFFLKDIGKTLNEIRSKCPSGEFLIEGKLNSAAECFGDPSANYSYYFYATQSQNMEDIADEYGERLKCAGIATSVGVFFPRISDDMSIEDFFTAIGVSDYKNWDDENIYWIPKGVIEFDYKGMTVFLDTVGFEEYVNPTTIKSSCSLLIINDEIEGENYDLIDLIFDLKFNEYLDNRSN